MASPILTNTSAQLNGGSMVVGFTTTLTDAQIKALPTTPVTLVAAPSSGTRIKVIGGSASLNCSAGAYTNINTTYCVLSVQVPAGYWVSIPLCVNDTSLTRALTGVTTLFGATSTRIIDLAPLANPVNPGAKSGSSAAWFVPTSSPLSSDVNGTAVQLAADNNGSGNFTGGNASNTLKVTLYIAYEAI
jgi:hypothetical protein